MTKKVDTLVPCLWWAFCDNDAVRMEYHPILGDVPICQRCSDKLIRLNQRH